MTKDSQRRLKMARLLNTTKDKTKDGKRQQKSWDSTLRDTYDQLFRSASSNCFSKISGCDDAGTTTHASHWTMCWSWLSIGDPGVFRILRSASIKSSRRRWQTYGTHSTVRATSKSRRLFSKFVVSDSVWQSLQLPLVVFSRLYHNYTDPIKLYTCSWWSIRLSVLLILCRRVHPLPPPSGNS